MCLALVLLLVIRMLTVILVSDVYFSNQSDIISRWHWLKETGHTVKAISQSDLTLYAIHKLINLQFRSWA